MPLSRIGAQVDIPLATVSWICYPPYHLVGISANRPVLGQSIGTIDHIIQLHTSSARPTTIALTSMIEVGVKLGHRHLQW